MALSMIPANENGIDSDSSRYVTVNGGHNRDVSFCQLLIAKIPQSEMKVGNIGIMRNLRRNWTRGIDLNHACKIACGIAGRQESNLMSHLHQCFGKRPHHTFRSPVFMGGEYPIGHLDNMHNCSDKEG